MYLGNRRSPRRQPQGPRRTVLTGTCGDSLTRETCFALGMFALVAAIVTLTALAKSAGWF